MPLAKAIVERVSVPHGLVGSDQLSRTVVDTMRQLSRLCVVSELVLGELVTEMELIRTRTSSLTMKVVQLSRRVNELDPLAITVPEGRLCVDGRDAAVHRRNSVTDYSGRVRRRHLFTADTRPSTVRQLHAACAPSPADVIAQCDIYRTDGKLGAAIFSVPIVCVHDQRAEDYLTSAATTRRRKTIGRTVKSLRPSNRLQSTSGNAVGTGSSDDDVTIPVSTSLPAVTDSDDVFVDDCPPLVKPETVLVDVTSVAYARQWRLRASSTMNLYTRSGTLDEGDEGTAADSRRLSSWRRTTVISDAAARKSKSRTLTVLDADDVDRSSQVSLTTVASSRPMSSRRRVTRTSTDRSTSSAYLNVDQRASSSWRQSLKSLLFGLVKTKSSVDLWATTTASTTLSSSKVDNVAGPKGEMPSRRKLISFRRAHSLPRSLRTRSADGGTGVNATKSKSVEDHLGESGGPEMTSPAGERLGRSLSLSRSQCALGSGGARNESRGRRPQSMEVHIVEIDENGRPLGDSGGRRSTGDRRVRVNIPDQPWTKPFADVRLRQRASRVESDKYQSSSGHWSGMSGSVGRDTPTTQSTYGGRSTSHRVTDDSAVSSLSSSSVDSRVSASNDDCVTLKGGSSNSTLDAQKSDDVRVCTSPASVSEQRQTTRPCTRRTHNTALATFNPFGCKRYSVADDVDRRIQGRVPASGGAGTSLRPAPPVPPRRTTSLQSVVDSQSHATSEIKKLASLADKMASSRRPGAYSSHTLQPRFTTGHNSYHKPLCAESGRTERRSSSYVVVTVDMESAPRQSELTPGAVEPGEVGEKLNMVEGCTTTADDWPIPPSSAGPVPDDVTRTVYDTVDTTTAANSTLVADKSAAQQVSMSLTAVDKRELAGDDEDMKQGGCDALRSGGPVSVSARLIITSPVANHAVCFSNPQKRSMCQPLTLQSTSLNDSHHPTLFRFSDVTSSSTPHWLSDSHVTSNSVLTGGFPAVRTDKGYPNNYGQSWYDETGTRCGVDSSPTVNLVRNPPQPSDTGSISSHSSLSSDLSSTSTELPRLLPRTATNRLTPTRDEAVTSLRAPSLPSNSADCSPSAVDRAAMKGMNLKKLKKSRQRRANLDQSTHLEHDTRTWKQELEAANWSLSGRYPRSSVDLSHSALTLDSATVDSVAYRQLTGTSKDVTRLHPRFPSSSNSLGRRESSQFSSLQYDGCHLSGAAGSTSLGPLIRIN